MNALIFDTLPTVMGMLIFLCGVFMLVSKRRSRRERIAAALLIVWAIIIVIPASRSMLFSLLEPWARGLVAWIEGLDPALREFLSLSVLVFGTALIWW